MITGGDVAVYAVGVFNRLLTWLVIMQAWNKRATVKYLMNNYREAIADCRMVLRYEPRHFPCLAGMALCYYKLSKQAELQAVEARKFMEECVIASRKAVDVHPGLTAVGWFAALIKQDNI
jgi:hypothetical protein